MTEQANTVVVQRDVPARVVPDGWRITIPENSFVNVQQALGGTYTVVHNGQMMRIDGTDADAINREARSFSFEPAREDGRPREEDLWQVLRTIYDPEIPVNVVDLGLVYGCDVIERDGENVVQVRMTLTAPTCGMGPVLVGDVEDRLALVPNVDRVEVELVFDPPWSREMISEEGLVELGLF